MSSIPTSSSGLDRLKKTYTPRPRAGWRPLLSAVAIITAFLLLIWGVFGDRLRAAAPVQVTRALLLPAADLTTQSPNRSKVLFQSSGWIEPDPWPIHVSALADGIVEEVLFQEGDLVEKHQLLATFVAEDAELALAQAKARLQEAEEQCHAHAAGTTASEQQVAVAQARESRAQASLNEAEDRWDRVRNLSLREVTESEKVEAEQRYQQALATLEEAVATRRQAEAHLEQQRNRQAAHTRVRDERAVDVEEAELHLSRMVIRAPMRGRIMKRLVAPGNKRMRAMDNPHSAEVAEMYDPEKLRVRVDVPLSEAGSLSVGQPTVITTSLLPQKEFEGVVERIVGIADLQRNTLQAKVTILDPHPRMRPETLCRVAFYAPPSEQDTPVASASSSSVWIPEDIADPGSDTIDVWVVSPEPHTVASRTVRLGHTTRDGYREVLEGLRVNELVVVSSDRPLNPGDRVTPSL